MDPLQLSVRPDLPEETRDSLIAISQLEPADSYSPGQTNAKDYSDLPEETRDSLIAISQLEPADSYRPGQTNAKDYSVYEEDKEEYRLKLISITYPEKSPDAETQPVNDKV